MKHAVTGIHWRPSTGTETRMRSKNVTLPLLGAAVVTVGALLVQLARKPEPRPALKSQERATAAADKALLERLRERGL